MCDLFYFYQKIALHFSARTGNYLAVRGGSKTAFVATIVIDSFLATSRQLKRGSRAKIRARICGSSMSTSQSARTELRRADDV